MEEFPSHFYPAGESYGDYNLSPLDASPFIELSSEMTYFGQGFDRIYVSLYILFLPQLCSLALQQNYSAYYFRNNLLFNL